MKEFSNGMFEYLSAIKQHPPNACGGHSHNAINYPMFELPYEEANQRGLTVYLPCPHEPVRTHPAITSKGELALMILTVMKNHVSISLE